MPDSESTIVITGGAQRLGLAAALALNAEGYQLVALQTLMETDDVAVTIDATHYCVKARGVMDSSSRTQTTALGGIFKARHKTRAEFLA
jgi:NAD(P)-dependent dehydrogenase (short-subunit alcohol dehydrogenase family)